MLDGLVLYRDLIEVNPPLWAFWRKMEPRTTEHPTLTEQEVVRRLDLFYFGDGTCNTG